METCCTAAPSASAPLAGVEHMALIRGEGGKVSAWALCVLSCLQGKRKKATKKKVQKHLRFPRVSFKCALRGSVPTVRCHLHRRGLHRFVAALSGSPALSPSTRAQSPRDLMLSTGSPVVVRAPGGVQGRAQPWSGAGPVRAPRGLQPPEEPAAGAAGLPGPALGCGVRLGGKIEKKEKRANATTSRGIWAEKQERFCLQTLGGQARSSLQIFVSP